MTLTLQPITRTNLWQVVDLKLQLHPEQEARIEDNVASIANAYVEPTFVPLAVYADVELLGFAMYGQHPTTRAWWVIRLMIDRDHQGKGYGRTAMEQMIDMMIERVGCEEIVTSFVPSNAVASKLYASLGFRPTGEWEDGEPLVTLNVAEWRPKRDEHAKPVQADD
jgi:diamine N-acetyltransferase